MIFKLTFLENRIVYAQAKDVLHLLKSYDSEYSDFQEIESFDEISDEEAKTILLKNTDQSTQDELDEFSLYNQICGDDFVIVGGTDFD
jgi:hypothetical protein